MVEITVKLNERELDLIQKGLECLVCNREIQELSSKINIKIKTLEEYEPNNCECLEYEKYFHNGQKYGRCYDCGEVFEIY